MNRELTIEDAFHTSWSGFSWRKRLILLRTLQVIRQSRSGEKIRGYLMKVLLRKTARKNIVWRMSAEQIVDCFYDIPVFHEPWHDFPIPKLTIRRFSWHKGISKQVFFPPKEKLSDISYYQWKWIDSKFTKYLVHAYWKQEAAATEELGKFIAAIYTPEGTPFHEDLLKKHGAALYRKLAFWEREILLESYINIRCWVMERYPNLLPASTHQVAKPVPFYTGHLWMELHYDLADTEAFKGYQAAGKARMHDALGYLDKKALEHVQNTSD